MEENNKKIEIQVINTDLIVIGEQKENNLWDVRLVNHKKNYNEIVRKDVTTADFRLFSNVILRQQFPIRDKIK